MKLVTYATGNGQEKIGAVKEDAIVDLSQVAPDMRTLFEGGEPAMEKARAALDAGVEVTPLDGAELRAPIIPRKFFHTAGNFREHHEESQSVGFSHPVNPWIIFFQNIDAIIGPDAPVVYPPHLTSELDYELELAVVLAKGGAHFDAAEAEDYVGGYVIFNDITARDIQRKEMESGIFSFCKAIDTFCPLGPWIVTPDEIPNVNELDMRLRVNGEERQHSNMRNISFSIPEILSHYSPLGFSPGDVLSTGTVSGVAGFQEDPQAWYLKPGDVVEAEVEGVGVLRNPVIAWEDAHGGPPPTAAVSASAT
jgi:2-keto-4-pentenoate hydratase/2-oxohepta-3-ene-1,7-dioic acid hydratase in catechol pathway